MIVMTRGIVWTLKLKQMLLIYDESSLRFTSIGKYRRMNLLPLQK